MKNFSENIFSIKNDGTNRVIVTILGISLKFKKKFKLQDIDNLIQEKESLIKEKNMLLYNYKNFQPISKKTKVYLLNDTRRDKAHLGCSTVINNIELLCAKYDMDIIFKDSAFPSKELDFEGYQEIIKKCDILLFNGEGTLHNDSAINMFEKCVLAKKLGKKVILINSVWQNNSITNKYLDLFDIITVRESLSKKEMQNYTNKEIQVIPDLTFYNKMDNNKFPDNNNIIFTDSVKSKITKKLVILSKRLNADFYKMSNSAIEGKILTEDIFQNLSQNSCIVTGRFHTLTFAMKYGIPTLAIESNTHKIQGMLKDASIDSSKYMINGDDNILDKVNDFINKEHPDFVTKAKLYSDAAPIRIEELFKNIKLA